MPGMPPHMSASMLTMLPPVLLMLCRIDFLGHQKAADQVGAHHRLEAFLVDADQRRGELAAGVVDQVMDAAVFGQHRRDHGLDRFFVADVADLEAGLAAVFEDFAAGLFQLFQLAPDQHHMGAEVPPVHVPRNGRYRCHRR